MCSLRKPKAVPLTREEETPLRILRNPLLDGMGPAQRAIRGGMNSLRIDREPRPNGLQVAR